MIANWMVTLLELTPLLIGAEVVLLAFSFLLSGMEAGVFALSPLRIRHQARAGNKRAKILNGYLSHPENFFWTILIGNTLANFFAVLLLVAFLYSRWPDKKLLCLIVILTAVFLLFTLCELLPKILFRRFPNRLCILMSGPFRLIAFFLSPLVGLVSRMSHRLLRWTGGQQFTGTLFVTREELRQVMQDTSHALSQEEQTMIDRVLDLQNLTVGQVLIPFSRVVSVEETTPMQEVLNFSRQKNFTRFPVWRQEGDRRRIAGLLVLRKLLYDPHFDPQKKASDYLQPALFLPENLRLEEALKRFQKSGQRLAIVLNDRREEVGIVTLFDVLRVIFGEMGR